MHRENAFDARRGLLVACFALACAIAMAFAGATADMALAEPAEEAAAQEQLLADAQLGVTTPAGEGDAASAADGAALSAQSAPTVTATVSTRYAYTNGKVTVTAKGANAQGDSDGLEYRFIWEKNNWAKSGTFQSWSSSSSATFTPTGTGTYRIHVYVRDSQGATSKVVKEVKVQKAPSVSATLSTSLAYTGYKVGVTASAQGGWQGASGYEYRFIWEKNNWAKSGTFQDWSSSSSATFTPTGTGTYRIHVYVRDSKRTIASCVKTLTVKTNMVWVIYECQMASYGTYEYDYNATGLLAKETHVPQSTSWSGYEYRWFSYNSAGKLSKIVEGDGGYEPTEYSTTLFSYNSAGRLVAKSIYDETSSADELGDLDYTMSYSYDGSSYLPSTGNSTKSDLTLKYTYTTDGLMNRLDYLTSDGNPISTYNHSTTFWTASGWPESQWWGPNALGDLYSREYTYKVTELGYKQFDSGKAKCRKVEQYGGMLTRTYYMKLVPTTRPVAAALQQKQLRGFDPIWLGSQPPI